MADTRDLKSLGWKRLCEFESRPGHHCCCLGGIDMAAKRLFRSRDKKVIAGLCGGIGEYFNIDPVIVRLIAIGLFIVGGCGGAVYLIGWIIVPREK